MGVVGGGVCWASLRIYNGRPRYIYIYTVMVRTLLQNKDKAIEGNILT